MIILLHYLSQKRLWKAGICIMRKMKRLLQEIMMRKIVKEKNNGQKAGVLAIGSLELLGYYFYELEKPKKEKDI